jgi:hypothetical protein
MGTVPRVLVRRTASPAHADFGGWSSGAVPVVVRLDVVSVPPRSSPPTVAGCLLGGYPVGRDWWSCNVDPLIDGRLTVRLMRRVDWTC